MCQQKYRHYRGHRRYFCYCHATCCLLPSQAFHKHYKGNRHYSTGTIEGKMHYSTDTIEGTRHYSTNTVEETLLHYDVVPGRHGQQDEFMKKCTKMPRSISVHSHYDTRYHTILDAKYTAHGRINLNKKRSF